MQSETVYINAILPNRKETQFTVEDGKFKAFGRTPLDKAATVDLCDQLVLPGLVDGHMHLDKTLCGLPWMPHVAERNRMSRIATDVSILRSLPLPTRQRAALLVDKCVAKGTAHMRTHVDIRPELGLSQLEEILAVRETCVDRVTIQIVAFPQSGVMRSRGVVELLDAAIGAGADLVGGIDPSVIDRDPRGQLDAIFGLADRRGVGVDIHLHEPAEIGLYSVEEICSRTKVLGLAGRVTVSHGFCLGAIPESAARRAAALMSEAGVMLVTHGGSSNTIPPIQMLREAGVNVFAGNDDIRDTWVPYGNGDMLERAAMIGWRSDFRHDDLISLAFDLASAAGAKALGIEHYGLSAGNPANFFTVKATCIPEAVAEHVSRGLVVYAGRTIARDGRMVI